jgi:hypothetical protein
VCSAIEEWRSPCTGSRGFFSFAGRPSVVTSKIAGATMRTGITPVAATTRTTRTVRAETRRLVLAVRRPAVPQRVVLQQAVPQQAVPQPPGTRPGKGDEAVRRTPGRPAQVAAVLPQHRRSRPAARKRTAHPGSIATSPGANAPRATRKRAPSSPTKPLAARAPIARWCTPACTAAVVLIATASEAKQAAFAKASSISGANPRAVRPSLIELRAEPGASPYEV